MSAVVSASCQGTITDGSTQGATVTVSAIVDGPFKGMYLLGVRPPEDAFTDSLSVMLTHAGVVSLVTDLQRIPEVARDTLTQS
jgi:hypothetical protein